MERADFAYLIGAEQGRIRWGRPMIFFTALFLSGLVYLILYRLYVSFFTPEESIRLTLFPHPLDFAETIISNLILVFLLLAVFYLIKNDLLALLAAVILSAPFDAVISFGRTAVLSLFSRYGSFASEELSEFPWLFVLVSSALFTFCFIGGITLALRLIKQTWLAILIGAVAGRIVYRICIMTYGSLTDGNFNFDLINFVFTILAGAVFAVALWFGLWMTADKTPLAEGEKPRLSKEFYAGTWTAILLVSIITLLIVITSVLADLWQEEQLTFAFLLLATVYLLILYSAIVFAVLIYKMWAAIQDGFARTTPGKAAGLLFIPFFNLYWMFQALPGFAKDFNAFVDRHNLSVRHLPVGLFTAYCVLILCTFIPFVGFITNLAAFFVGIAMILKICDAVNALPASAETMSK